MVRVSLRNQIEPLYFGVSPKRLYGCHHLPQSSNVKACGVVICCPIGQEYIRSHRAVYQLALGLTRAGFHVLRFDYFGCGDSEGDFEQGSLHQWAEDVDAAIAEIRRRAQVTKVCMIGLRIGATLALNSVLCNPHVDSIALWEPVFEGRRYLRQLVENQRKFLERYRGKSRRTLSKSIGSDEILGFPMTSKLKQDLEGIKMNHLSLRHDISSLLLWNSDESSHVEEVKHFKERHPRSAVHTIIEPKVWELSLYKRIIPLQTLHYLIDWAYTLQP